MVWSWFCECRRAGPRVNRATRGKGTECARGWTDLAVHAGENMRDQRDAIESRARPSGEADSNAGPVLDVVIPVYNEAASLPVSIERLYRFLTTEFPFTWRITIVDNASTDRTNEVAEDLAASMDQVESLHLDRKGRGLALRTAWARSDAEVVAYMDVDLSTGLDALLPLVAPLISGHSDVAIGSRLAAGANVARGPKREFISRAYNLILHGLFANRFHDAQCGFKAVRADVVRRLLPEVEDDGWFFDTELLLVAEHNGLRIHELAVDWVDDPDSRVDIGQTAKEDLKGSVRVAWRFATGGGEIDFGDQAREPFRDDLGRRNLVFALVGGISTMVTLTVFLVLRPELGPNTAVVIALVVTSFANSWAHRRWSFGRRGGGGFARHASATIGLALGGIGLSLIALAVIDRIGGGVAGEVAALTVAWALVALARYQLLGRLADDSPGSTPGEISLQEAVERAV